MADYSGLDEATLNEKLNEATDYDERAAIRKALRQLKKEQGRPVGRATKRGAAYNRFAGVTATATKPVTPKSFIGKEGAEHSPARGPTPIKARPTHSPAVSTPPPPTSPPPQDPSPQPQESPAPTPVSPDEDTDGIPPHTEEPEPPASPEVPSLSPPRPRSPSPPPSPPTDKFQEEEEVDGDVEEAEPEEEGAEPEEEVEVNGTNEDEEAEPEDEPEDEEVEPEDEPKDEEVEPEDEPKDEEVEPEDEEVEPEDEEAEPDEEEAEEEEEESEPVDDKPDVEEEEEEKKPRPPPVGEKPKPTATDDSDGSPFGARFRKKRPDAPVTSPREKEGGAKVEFQGFRLRKTLSQEQQGKSSSPRVHDFGVKLRSRPSASTTDALPSKTEQQPSSEMRSRAKTFGSAHQTPSSSSSSSSSSSGPRTLRDYQELSARNQRSKVRSPDEGESEGGSTLPVDELQRYLVAYVNQELALSPSIPSRGKALYDVCSDTGNLCKLINKSVRNTVDLRALTTITASMAAVDREEADQENMTLTIESARAIGCQVTDSTGDLVLRKDPPTIRGFLIDLIRARVVNMPGMDDEPQSTFTNLSVLFSKLGISECVDGGDGEEGGGEGEGGEGVKWREEDREGLKKALRTPPKSPPTGRSWRDMDKPPSPTPQSTSSALTYEERAAQRRAEREKKEQEMGKDTTTLTYEERAAMRRTERERRRQERAELASSQ